MTKSNSKISLLLLFFIVIFCTCKKETITTTKDVDGNNSSISVNGIDTTILAENIAFFNTTNSSELVSSILMAQTPLWDTGEVIFSVYIPQLKQGDIILAKAETQGTMPTYFTTGDNVAFVGALRLTDSPTKKPNQSPNYEISEDNGFNIVPDMGHGVMVKLGTYTCPNDFTDMYVNFSCKAYSNAAIVVNPPNDYLTIPQDYGRLSVTVYRNQ